MGKKPQLNYAETARNMGLKGLRVIFNLDLVADEMGIYVSGATFYYDILQGCNIEERAITLAEDYEVWQNLGRVDLMFRSGAPGRLPVTVAKEMVKSIKDLSNNKILYCT